MQTISLFLLGKEMHIIIFWCFLFWKGGISFLQFALIYIDFALENKKKNFGNAKRERARTKIQLFMEYLHVFWQIWKKKLLQDQS